MTELLWGYLISVVMEIFFVYVPPFVRIKDRGLFSTTSIKKEDHGPNHMEVQESIVGIKVQYVETIRERTGTVSADN